LLTDFTIFPSGFTNSHILDEEHSTIRGVNLISQIKEELDEEYERFADHSIWSRTEIMVEGDTRYFIAWLHSTEGIDEMVSIMGRLCVTLKCLFQAASDFQKIGQEKMGKLEAWLEAKISIGTRSSEGRGCFTLRLDPGGMQGETVTTSIISPEGDEVGACVFEI
jgi:hypothetical protein